MLSSRLVEGRPKHFVRVYEEGGSLWVEGTSHGDLLAYVGDEPVVAGVPQPLEEGSEVFCEDWAVRIEKASWEQQLHAWVQASPLSSSKIASVMVQWMCDVMEVCLKRERGLLPEQRMAYETRLELARDRAEQSPERLVWEGHPKVEELSLFIRTETYGKNHVSVPHSRATLDNLCDIVDYKSFSFTTLYQFLSCAAWSGVHCERLYGSLRREKAQKKAAPQEASSFAEAFERVNVPTLWERTVGLFSDGSNASTPSKVSSKAKESRKNNQPISDDDWAFVVKDNVPWQLDWLKSRLSKQNESPSAMHQEWEDVLFEEME
ncbi:MAG: hypothetical protein EP343_14155 [Deltaproteobacteria bacterium]|nr:MAG: hypothetical protein EP343_14155 [Deltaproteobacteria bacterium]